jgi:SAM-dependent methyltransferase
VTNQIPFTSIRRAVVNRYRPHGQFHAGFVSGKTRFDPVFSFLLDHENHWIKNPGTILDIGCGRGILLNLVSVAIESDGLEMKSYELIGIDNDPNTAIIAQKTLAFRAKILKEDIRYADIPLSDTVLLIDVLHYLSHDEQEHLLRKISKNIKRDGFLIFREGNKNRDIRFKLTQWVESILAFLFRHEIRRHYYRSTSEWINLLYALGFQVDAVPMSKGTPFANVLFVARINTESQGNL